MSNARCSDSSVPRLSMLLDEVESSYRVDPDRVYLTGISMGGYGTWRLAAAQPDRFAAIAPICGGGNPTEACNLKDLPVWAFHGARDCGKRTAQRAIASCPSASLKGWSRH